MPKIIELKMDYLHFNQSDASILSLASTLGVQSNISFYGWTCDRTYIYKSYNHVFNFVISILIVIVEFDAN